MGEPCRGSHTSVLRSRLALLKLVCLGCLAVIAVPAFAATGGSTVFQLDQEASLLSAPPPVVFMALGLLMILGAVGRRLVKGAKT